MLKMKLVKIVLCLVLCLSILLASFSSCFALTLLSAAEITALFITALGVSGLTYNLRNISPSQSLPVFVQKFINWTTSANIALSAITSDSSLGVIVSPGKTYVQTHRNSYARQFYDYLIEDSAVGDIPIYEESLPDSRLSYFDSFSLASQRGLLPDKTWLLSVEFANGQLIHYYLSTSLDLSNTSFSPYSSTALRVAKNNKAANASSPNINLARQECNLTTSSFPTTTSLWTSSINLSSAVGFSYNHDIPWYDAADYPVSTSSTPIVNIDQSISVDNTSVALGADGVSIPTDVPSEWTSSAEDALMNTYDPYITLGYDTAGTVTGDGVETGTGTFGNIGQWILNIPILGDILRLLQAILNFLLDFFNRIGGAITIGISNWYNNSPLKISIDNLLNTLGGFNLGGYLSTILAFISGYSLFHGLLTGYLPSSIATVLWSAWLVLICFWVIRFCIDR